MDAAATPPSDTELFLNRELAQIEFNFRVLAQAADASVPLLERLRYLCIACTNLDEFFDRGHGQMIAEQVVSCRSGYDRGRTASM